VCISDLPGIVADRGKRQLVLRVGQPGAVLHAAADGDRGVLHVHLAKGEPAEGARRARAQRRQHGAAVQDEGDHHDHVRGGAVRGVVAAALRGVLDDQVLAAAAGRRELHGGLASGRAVAGCRQLVHQPAAVRHIQPQVPGRLPGPVVRQDLPSVRLQQLGAVSARRRPGRYRGRVQAQQLRLRQRRRPRPQSQDHRRHIRARRPSSGRPTGSAANGSATAAAAHSPTRQVVVGQGNARRRRVHWRFRGAVLSDKRRKLVRVTRQPRSPSPGRRIECRIRDEMTATSAALQPMQLICT